MTESEKSPALVTTEQDFVGNGSSDGVPIFSIAQREKMASGRIEKKRIKKESAVVESKSRVWWCVVYPESAPDDWKELCQRLFLETYISPLHDRDVNATGEVKKAHWHVVLCWTGPTTYDNAKKLMQTFGGVIEPKPVGSMRGVARYLCHLDNPEKVQYNPADVISLNGADYQTAIDLVSDKYAMIAEMEDWCDRFDIMSYQVLSQYARESRQDWWRCLCDNGSYVIDKYLKARFWMQNNASGAYGRSLEEVREMEEKLTDGKPDDAG